MDRKYITMGVEKFKQVFSENKLNTLGINLKFSQKLRKITPSRLGISLISLFAERKIETIADTHRGFNELNGEDVQYKPYHNQLAKKEFPEFMRQLVCRMLKHFVIKTLSIENKSPFSMFKKIVVHDGSAFGIKSDLEEYFPGKFNNTPAAVELHATMDLLNDEVISISLAPFIDAETKYLPLPEEVTNSLLLIDRAYLNLPYLSSVNENQGSFIVRSKHHINPTITAHFDQNTNQYVAPSGRKLKEIKLSRNKTHDFDVEWKTKGKTVSFRLIVKWNKHKKEFLYLLTNLPRKGFSVEHILLAYRLRWQIELLFKEWKSYGNLRKFDTANPHIAEGFIWAALGAAIVKRFLAHLAQYAKKVIISTRTSSMCVGRKLFSIFESLTYSDFKSLADNLMKTIEFLAKNARRSHPNRDKEKGRMRLGFTGVFDD